MYFHLSSIINAVYEDMLKNALKQYIPKLDQTGVNIKEQKGVQCIANTRSSSQTFWRKKNNLGFFLLLLFTIEKIEIYIGFILICIITVNARKFHLK